MARFTDEDVREMLTSQVPHNRIAKEFGCSSWLVAMIRYGRRYAETVPDVERWENTAVRGKARSCWDCLHCKGEWVRLPGSKGGKMLARCGLGLPDVISEGARFGRFCNAFIAAPERQDAEGVAA